AKGRRTEDEGKCQVDRGVGENEDEGRCALPSQVASERKVGESESRNDQKRQVVHVLMWAQDQRSRDRQGEIESRLVWPPAQRESHQSQEQDENGQRQALAAARHSLEHVAERVDSGIRVDDLAVGRQR